MGSSEYDIGSPFSRRGEQGKAEDIGGDGYLAVCRMCLLHKVAVVFHISACVGVLQYAGEYVGSEFGFLIFSCAYLYALRNGTRSHHRQCLRENILVHEHDVCT